MRRVSARLLISSFLNSASNAPIINKEMNCRAAGKRQLLQKTCTGWLPVTIATLAVKPPCSRSEAKDCQAPPCGMSRRCTAQQHRLAIRLSRCRVKSEGRPAIQVGHRLVLGVDAGVVGCVPTARAPDCNSASQCVVSSANKGAHFLVGASKSSSASTSFFKVSFTQDLYLSCKTLQTIALSCAVKLSIAA